MTDHTVLRVSYGLQIKRQPILGAMLEVEDHEPLAALRDLWIDFKADPVGRILFAGFPC